MGKDEASEGYEEIGGRAGGGRVFRKEFLKSREAMNMRDVRIQGGGINGDKQDVGVKGIVPQACTSSLWHSLALILRSTAILI